MQKYIELLGILFCIVHCSAVQAAQRAHGIELCSAIVEYEGEAYFCGKHHRLGRELFRTNGTSKGTFLVADIDPGPGGSSPVDFFKLRGELYFFAETTHLGREIWRTDGTAQGTKRISDAFPGPDGFQFGVQVVNGSDRAYLGSRVGWWRTDGSSDGTELLLPFGDPLGEPRIVGFSGNSVYFQRHLVDSDGQLIAGPLERISKASNTSQIVKDFGKDCFFNDRLTFTPKSSQNNNSSKLFVEMNCFSDAVSPRLDETSLVATEGTAQTTRVVIRGRSEFLGKLGDQRYYFNTEKGKIEFTDGLTTHTLGFCAGQISCYGASREDRFEVNNKIVFGLQTGRIDDNSRVRENVYASDGTLQGTTEIAQGILLSSQVVGAMAVFNTIDDGGGRTLWTSDGTASGTKILRRFPVSDWQIHGMATQFLIFGASAGQPLTLWRSSGRNLQEVSTFSSRHRRAFSTLIEGDRLYFLINDFLWHSDGTEEGTYRLTYLSDVVTSPPSDSNAFFIYPLLDLLLGEK